MTNTLKLHKKIWKNKKILREAYLEWYTQIIADLKQSNNKTIEIGSGCGNFKEFKPDIVACDIESNPWIDMSFDAQKIPFKNQSIANIVLVDTLHHLSDPIAFLDEAGRVLEKKGRIILVEPYPSVFSSIIYSIFHPEPFIMDIDYRGGPNQAIAYLLFFRNFEKKNNIYKKNFSLIKRKKMSFILYPASGGFKNKALVPNFLIPLIKFFEYLLKPFSDFLAFRCYILLEKK